ncbi:hypothetical protein GCM10029978_017690 [Actinoallomurus acanthiterrae]
MRRDHHRQGGAVAARGEGPGVAVRQDPAALRHERKAIFGHPGGGRRLLGRDVVRLRQRRTPLRVRLEHPLGAPGEVHRGGPGAGENLRGLRDVLAERGGQRDAVPPGDAEQRSAADGETLDGRDDGGNIPANQDDLLTRQPRLVE